MIYSVLPWASLAVMEDDDTNGLIGDLIRFGMIQSVDMSGGLVVVEAGEG